MVRAETVVPSSPSYLPFHHAAPLFRHYQGSCGGALGCDDDDECSSVVGDLDHALISNLVRLGPKRTGEGEVLRGNEGIRRHFEEQSWNSSSYSSWASGLNEKLGKDNPGVGWC